MELSDSLVQEIRDLADKQGLSSLEIARQVGISRPAVANILAGRRHSGKPHWANIFKAVAAGDDEFFDPPLPAVSTHAMPGGWDRIEIYRKRLENGEHLHHPDDLVCFAEIGEYTEPRGTVKPPKSRGKEAA